MFLYENRKKKFPINFSSPHLRHIKHGFSLLLAYSTKSSLKMGDSMAVKSIGIATSMVSLFLSYFLVSMQHSQSISSTQMKLTGNVSELSCVSVILS